ncbi:MAG: sugar-binding protein, partial [Planctomycetota bacterium]
LKNDPPIAWVIAGDKGLRVRFRCPAAEGTLQAAKISEHDDNVWLDDSVEVFIDPDLKGRSWYQLAVSANNVSLDSNSLQGRDWEPRWFYQVRRKQSRYNVEIMIPYEALGFMTAPKSGTKWAINLTRNHYKNGRCEVAQAAPTHGPNSRSGCYMVMTFE